MFDEEKNLNPYIGGLLLGLVLLVTFVIFGRGLGASGAVDRFSAFIISIFAPNWIKAHPYWHKYYVHGHTPLNNFLVFLLIGVFFGGLVTAYFQGKLKIKVQHGPRISKTQRYVIAFIGGMILAIATRFSRGCTSGQALTGGAELAVGSWIFMIAFFISGPITALFIKKFWR